MKMSFNSHANKTHFHKKGFVLCLVFKVRIFGTLKMTCLTPGFRIFVIPLCNSKSTFHLFFSSKSLPFVFEYTHRNQTILLNVYLKSNNMKYVSSIESVDVFTIVAILLS